MIKKIRKLKLFDRIILFILFSIFWFTIAYFINSDIEDDYSKSQNLRNLWILSGIVLAILWAIFFPKKKKE